MTLGEKIRFYRKREGITQAELGKLLGVQNSAVSKWEKGRVDNLSVSQIQTMAEVFHISPMNLTGWEADVFRQPMIFDLYGAEEKPTAQGDGLKDRLSKLDPDLLKLLADFVALAQANPDTAKRHLSFAVQELQSSQQDQ